MKKEGEIKKDFKELDTLGANIFSEQNLIDMGAEHFGPGRYRKGENEYLFFGDDIYKQVR